MIYIRGFFSTQSTLPFMYSLKILVAANLFEILARTSGKVYLTFYTDIF